MKINAVNFSANVPKIAKSPKKQEINKSQDNKAFSSYQNTIANYSKSAIFFGTKIPKKERNYIIEAYARGESCADLAKEYEVHVETIEHMISKLENADQVRAKHKANAKKIKDSIIRETSLELVKEYAQGATRQDLRAKYKLPLYKIAEVISQHEDAQTIKHFHRVNRNYKYDLTADARSDYAAQQYALGRDYLSISRDIHTSRQTVANIIEKRKDADEIRSMHRYNRRLSKKIALYEDKESVIERYSKGVPIEELAAEYEVTKNKILELIAAEKDHKQLKGAHKAAVIREKHPEISEREAYIIEQFKKGKSQTQIALELGVYQPNVSRTIRKQINASELIEENRAARRKLKQGDK